MSVLLGLTITGRMTAGDLAVAVGTIALALVTVWLGREARASTKAAQRSADVAEVSADAAKASVTVAEESVEVAKESVAVATEAVEASEEPFVIATPTDNLQLMRLFDYELPQGGEPPPLQIHRTRGSTEGPFVRLRLWNIGPGSAVVTAVGVARLGDPNVLGPLHQHYALGPGGVADIEIPSPRWPAVLGDGTLTIDYFRASGTHYRTTSLASIGDPTVQCRTYERTRL